VSRLTSEVNAPSQNDVALRSTEAIIGSRLASGKTLVEMTTYDNIAMWWFVDAEFYHFLAGILNTHLDHGMWRRRARKIYRGTEFVMQFFQSLLIREVIRRHERGGRSGGGCKENVPKILFTSPGSQWRVVRDEETARVRKSDVFFDPILKKLQDKCELVSVDPLNTLNLALLRDQIPKWRILADKLQNWNVCHRPFELYWSLDAWRMERAASKHFTKAWRNLRRDRTFGTICAKVEGTGRLVEMQLEYYFNVAFPRAARYIHMAKGMIEKEKPNLILLENEYGLFQRATVVAAKRLGVPTVAVQHGVIHSKHRGYMHSTREISPNGGVESPFCPIPDRTAVYGPIHKYLLTDLSVYPPDRVVVTGQPRYDRMAHIERLYSRERFLQQRGIDPEHKVILWTTQCHGLSMEENHRNFTTVLGTVSRLEKVTLIIKQHHNEGPTYARMIRNYLANQNVNAVITSGDSDTYEQLFACDLLISKTSTTIIEAVALGKPAIILNLTGRAAPIGLDFAKEGIAVDVSRADDLGAAIQELLVDDRKLARNRMRFLKRYLYKLDGKATERLINLIWETLRF
jgi:hypothetical protein